jgi:hypoxanthine phosphoribosyltransferase
MVPVRESEARVNDPAVTPRVLVPEEALRLRVRAIADQINADYDGRELSIVCTLGGATVFCADLMRHLKVPARLLFMSFSGYGGPAGKSGEVRIHLDIAEPLEGRHVIVLEGAVISGRTPWYVVEMLKLRQPASIRFGTLLLKRASLKVPLPLDYVGFEIADQGIAIGYGMGHDAGHRSLPYIAAIDSPH